MNRSRTVSWLPRARACSIYSVYYVRVAAGHFLYRVLGAAGDSYDLFYLYPLIVAILSGDHSLASGERAGAHLSKIEKPPTVPVVARSYGTGTFHVATEDY